MNFTDGYYYFLGTGKLCRKAYFHNLNITVNGKKSKESIISEAEMDVRDRKPDGLPTENRNIMWIKTGKEQPIAGKAVIIWMPVELLPRM